MHNSNNQITILESLYKGFSSFKNDILNQYNNLSVFLLNIKDDLIKPLSNLYEASLQKLNYYIYEMNSLERSYQSSVTNLENTKIIFIFMGERQKRVKLEQNHIKRKMIKI